MDPFKTGPNGMFATALVSLEGSVHDGLVLIGYGMYRNCLKLFMANLYFFLNAKIKMTDSISGPAGKKKKLPARLLVQPWPDQPDRLLRPCH